MDAVTGATIPAVHIWTMDADEILASIQRTKTKTNSFTHY